MFLLVQALIRHIVLKICSFFQISKQQYHCDECGICRYLKFIDQFDNSGIFSIRHCLIAFDQFSLLRNCFYRIGGSDNFFHCKKCGELVSSHISTRLIIWEDDIIECNHIYLLNSSHVSDTKHVYFCLGCCYSVEIKEGHNCVERAMHHNCPICFEVKTKTNCY